LSNLISYFEYNFILHGYFTIFTVDISVNNAIPTDEF